MASVFEVPSRPGDGRVEVFGLDRPEMGANWYRFAVAAVPELHEAGKLGGLLDEMRAHLAKTYSIEEMARFVNMSRRTFLRRFTSAMGTTPVRWLVLERLAKAVDYLENTVISIEEIARLIGFSSTSTFRQQFQKRYSLSPMAYRKMFSDR